MQESENKPKVRMLEAGHHNPMLMNQSESYDNYEEESSDIIEPDTHQEELRRLEQWNMELDNYQEGDLQIEDFEIEPQQDSL